MNKDISIWLIPEEKYLNKFQLVINDLASRYNSYSFIPHITVYYLGNALDCLRVVKDINEEIKEQKPITLSAEGVFFSEIFTKTLYLQCKINNDLSLLYTRLKKRFNLPVNYELNPHMSLIYKRNMNVEDKKAEMKKIIFPEIITFNKLMVITKEGGTISQEKDVLEWKIEFQKEF